MARKYYSEIEWKLEMQIRTYPTLETVNTAKDKYAEPLECQESQVQGTNCRHDFPVPTHSTDVTVRWK